MILQQNYSNIFPDLTVTNAFRFKSDKVRLKVVNIYILSRHLHDIKIPLHLNIPLSLQVLVHFITNICQFHTFLTV